MAKIWSKIRAATVIKFPVVTIVVPPMVVVPSMASKKDHAITDFLRNRF